MKNILSIVFISTIFLMTNYTPLKATVICSSQCQASRSCIDTYAPIYRTLGIESQHICYQQDTCFGSNDTSKVPVQQYPITILKDQDIYFNISLLLKNASLTFEILKTFSYNSFIACNLNESTRFNYSHSIDGLLQLNNITTGKQYFLFSTNHKLYSCKFGFRLQLNVFDHTCYVGNNTICSNHGQCSLNKTLSIYQCSCCFGFYGQYCEEYDGCSVNTCLNNASCVDIINGSNSNAVSCLCTSKFVGKLCDSCIPGFTGEECTKDIDECTVNKTICNYGNCSNTVGSFHCLCPLNVTGTLCDIDTFDNCLPNLCSLNATCIDKYGGFKCKCPLGFTGQYCEKEINECAKQPCTPEGTSSCIDLVRNYSCKCITGFTGQFCETDINECFLQPCSNGGLCLDVINDYQCACQPGYDGKNCETITNKCQILKPCQNNATCRRTGNNFRNYTCDCLPGWMGRNCSGEIDECLSQPCLNNATCMGHFNNFTCKCITGWTGNRCERNIDICSRNPCENNSTCIDSLVGLDYSCLCLSGFTSKNCSINIDDCLLSNVNCNNGMCVDFINNFKCQCKLGWYGKYCDTNQDLCSQNPCVNSILCENVNTTVGYECRCKAGFTGQSCIMNIDDCVNNSCQNGAVCIDLINNYNCSCPPGFEGIYCEKDINECRANPCMNNATCKDFVNQYFCECKPGFNGTNCEYNIDDCVLEPCQNNGTCIDQINNFTCKCLPGYTFQDCSVHFCDLSSTCENNSTCLRTEHGYKCLCSRYFTGGHCESSIDECLSGPCQNNATCVDMKKGYRCDCSFPYSGDFCEKHLCDCNICQNGANCISSPDNYHCQCVSGFSGKNCEKNLNECLNNSCSVNGTLSCKDVINNYTCICHGGYTGQFCDTHICEKSPVCNNGTCIKLQNGYNCKCDQGFTGPTCGVNINECINITCGVGKCVDGVNNYTCVCPVFRTGRHCEIDLDYCASVPCYHNRSCLNIVSNGTYSCDCGTSYFGKNCEAHICNVSNPCNNGTCNITKEGFNCSCFAGFTGLYCEHDINECNSKPCLNDGICSDGIDNFTCLCPRNFTGLQCETYINFCESSPCFNNGSCLNNYTTMNFECNCLQAFSGLQCQFHECDIKNPCQNNASCLRTSLQPRCSCSAGYTSQNCSVEINECISFPCLNDGKCSDLLNGYQCNCSNRFSGRNCEIILNYCNSTTCLNGGTCRNNYSNNSFACSCSAYYKGRRCEEQIEGSCSPSPCLNNGICQENQNGKLQCNCLFGFEGSHCQHFTCPCEHGRCVRYNLKDPYTCICDVGFNGTYCEQSVGDCRNISDPNLKCIHQSFCQNTTFGYSCICPPHLQGKQCNMAGGCNSNTCQNGATCVETKSTYKCYCQPGFTGNVCEFDINECISSPCLNNGSCTEDNLNNFKCYCQPGFNGSSCQKIINQTNHFTSSLHSWNPSKSKVGSKTIFTARSTFLSDASTSSRTETFALSNTANQTLLNTENRTMLYTDHRTHHSSSTFAFVRTMASIKSNMPYFSSSVKVLNKTVTIPFSLSVASNTLSLFSTTLSIWSITPSTFIFSTDIITAPTNTSLSTPVLPSRSRYGSLLTVQLSVFSSVPVRTVSLQPNFTESSLSTNSIDISSVDKQSTPIITSEFISHLWMKTTLTTSKRFYFSNSTSYESSSKFYSLLQSAHSDASTITKTVATTRTTTTILVKTSMLPSYASSEFSSTDRSIRMSSQDLYKTIELPHSSLQQSSQFKMFTIQSPITNRMSPLQTTVITANSGHESNIFPTTAYSFSSSKNLSSTTKPMSSIISRLPISTYKYFSKPTLSLSTINTLSISKLVTTSVINGSKTFNETVNLTSILPMQTPSLKIISSISTALLPTTTLLSLLTLQSTTALSSAVKLSTNVKTTAGLTTNQPTIALSLSVNLSIKVEPSSASTVEVISTTAVTTTVPTTTQRPHLNLTCSDDPCNGFTCINETDNGLSFRCICPFPSIGPLCVLGMALHFPRFNGHSYIVLPHMSLNGTANNILMAFHTLSSNALLLYANHSLHKDFIMISIVDGFLVFSFSTGGETLLIRSHTEVNHGHTVQIYASFDSRTGTATLSLNNKESISKVLRSSLRSIQLTSSWYLGGIPADLYTASHVNFTGCIKTFQVNSKPFSLTDPNQVKSWLSISECDISACERGACRNNATCIKDIYNLNKYECQCQSGYFGDDCSQTVNHCSGDPCNGHGECVRTASRHHCLCYYGKLGPACLIDTFISMPHYSVFENYSSYIEYPSNMITQYALGRFEIRFQFKIDTGSNITQNGLMAYLGQSTIGSPTDDFLAVGILNEHIVLIFNLGDGPVILKSKQPIELSRKWHFVVAGRTRQHGYLYFNSHQKTTGSSSGLLTGLDVNTPLYLGGVPDFSKLPFVLYGYFTRGFSGTIHDAAIRTTDINFVPLLTLTRNQVSQNMIGIPVDHGLNINNEGVDQCNHLPCANNGTCIATGTSFTCKCKSPYIGSLCYDKQLSCIDYNPCHPGSTCRSDGYVIQCDCSYGWMGIYCTEKLNISFPYFKADSYLVLRPLRIRSSIILTLNFKADAANGLLFYVSRNIQSRKGDFMAISLWQRYLYVRYNLGTHTASMRSRKKIQLFNWHSLYLRRERKDAIMRLDNNYMIGVRSSGPMTMLDVASQFYLGGVPYLSSINIAAVKDVQAQSDFVGCISSFTVNGQEFQLNSSNRAIIGKNIADCGSSCSNHQCRNNAKCVSFNSTQYECQCSLGDVGQICEQSPRPFTIGLFSSSSYWFTRASLLSSSLRSYYELSFKTEHDGLILWHGKLRDKKSDLLVVGIVNGKLQLTLVLDNHESSAVINQLISINVYHKLRIDRIGNTVQFFVNGYTPRIVLIPTSKKFLENNGYFFLGGLPGNIQELSSGRYTSGFNGCIANVTFTGNEKYINFASTHNARGLNIQPYVALK